MTAERVTLDGKGTRRLLRDHGGRCHCALEDSRKKVFPEGFLWARRHLTQLGLLHRALHSMIKARKTELPQSETSLSLFSILEG